MLRVGRLTAEHLVDPLGLDVAAPRLSWVVEADRRTAHQRAYRVMVTGDRSWDSGWVESPRTTDIAYGGVPLAPEDRCEWRLEVKDDAGAIALSDVARFERMPAEWTGTWICLPPPMDAHDANRPCVHVRTIVELPEGVSAARLHVTAGGLIEPWLNGARVGDDCLAPGWTDFARRVRCRSFDVTRQVRTGPNAVGAVIGDGWYAGRIGWEGERAHYGRIPVGRMELVVRLENGEVIRRGTDHHWKARFGPVRSGDLLGGEYYDARDALGDWAAAGYDDREWEFAWPDPGPQGTLVATPCEPVRVVSEIPARISEGRAGSWMADVGEVVAGWTRLTFAGAPGQVVRVRSAEVLDGAADLYTANLRGAQCTDTVVLSGERSTYEPWSTFRGFRHVEITGAEPEAAVGVALSTDARPTGEFSCSSDLLNDVWAAARRTSRNLRIALPTDCIQRDERLGWLADADVGFNSANYFSDLGNFYAGWLQEVRGAQSAEGAFPDVAPRLVKTDDGAPGWGDAGVLVPWALWQWYADRRVLEESVDSMRAWPRWILQGNPDFRWRQRRGDDFGDWLAPGDTAPKDVVAQAYWARSAAVAAAACRVLDRPDPEMEDIALRTREAFITDYVDATGRVGNGAQTAQLLGLVFELVPPDLRGPALGHLIRDVGAIGLGTGFLGVRYLLPTLTDAGEVELAYRLALSESCPSWGHMIRSGATTIWERWDSWTAEKGFANPYMNSFCHSSFGTIAEWLHSTVGGLSRDTSAPGWSRAVVRPRPGGGVTWGRTSYDSRIGRWAVDWSMSGPEMRVDIQVPCGGEATVDLPGRDPAQVTSGAWSFTARQENSQG
ncbi:MAG TPA: family 78 glycoside hydrolase catalytic domain [Acidimicrobiales bacterium]|nr:family 78 glycoside hydrolase catalytic domain [Acidimicrobiales bacterium]